MKLQVATLVAGTETPAGDGINGALRCVLILPDGARCAAVLKRAPLGQVAAEAFSALGLRAWGLSVPNPYLVDEGGTLAFASVDLGYPNFKHHLGVNALPKGVLQDAAIQIAIDFVCQLKSVGLAAACDEAIDNRDRNLGNILWDGANESWIDHAAALGQHGIMLDCNKLCRMSIGTIHEHTVKGAALTHHLVLDRGAPVDAEQGLQATALVDGGLANFVAARLSTLGHRLLRRFPAPRDLFSDQ